MHCRSPQCPCTSTLLISCISGLLVITLANSALTTVVSSENVSTINKCPYLKNCSCRVVASNKYSINCTHLFNITAFQEVIHERFRYQTIHELWVRNSSISLLPQFLFTNLTMERCFFHTSSVQVVDDDAFYNVSGLVQLGMRNTKLSLIPQAIGCLRKDLQVLHFRNGDLEAIGKELQNFTHLISLQLQTNRISEVDEDAFVGLFRLQYLDLSSNRISHLHPTIFRDTTELLILMLRNNSLTTVQQLFSPLSWTLKTLLLDNNKLTNVKNWTTQPFKRIETLTLANNSIVFIEDSDLFGETFNQLIQLDLKGNHLQQLPYDVFNNFIRLRWLYLERNELGTLDNRTLNIPTIKDIDLSINYLTSISGFFANTPLIERLFLTDNLINDLDQDCFEILTKVGEIRLRNNSLNEIKENQFLHNGELVRLELGQNNISLLHPNSFSGLYKLEILMLHSNQLISLNRSLQNLTALEFLDVSYNRLTKLTEHEFFNMPNLHKIILKHNLLYTVEGAFASLKNLVFLQIRQNKLQTLTRESLPANWQQLYLIDMSRNPVSCDCRMLWLIEWYKSHPQTRKVSPICSQPQWLKSKYLISLSKSDLIYWKGNCSPKCQCLCHANNTNVYIEAKCERQNLTKIPSPLPNATVILDVSENQITALNESNICVDIANLKSLNIEHNALISLDNIVCLRKLQTLKLAYNNLQHFPPLQEVQEMTFNEVTLSNNPWLCTCIDLPFIKWVQKWQNRILDINETVCNDVPENENVRNRLVVNIKEADICPNWILIYSMIAVGILVFLLIIASTKIGYNHYKMNIKIWLYTRGICTCLPCVKEDDIDDDKNFDAFISYSNNDHEFVVCELLPYLENHPAGYRICIHYKHFEVGEYISSNILNAVGDSRKTIIILSRNFLESEWCRLEFKSAHQKVLEDKMNRLIIIVYGELPEEDKIDPDIKLHLESNTYLKWGEKYFWDKLVYALPKKGKLFRSNANPEQQPLLGSAY